MSITDLLAGEDERRAADARLIGVAIAIVTNNQDPDGLGRVRVRFPWLSDTDESPWARVASVMAGRGRGVLFLPEVDDEVLVAFDRGDMRFPYVIGALWNGQDKPPAANEDGRNDVRMIRSRSGHVVKLNDKDGAETIEIVDRTGKNAIVVDSAKNTIAITSDQDITLTAASGTITLKAKTLSFSSSGDTSASAGGSTELKSGGTLTVKGATVNIN